QDTAMGDRDVSYPATLRGGVLENIDPHTPRWMLLSDSDRGIRHDTSMCSATDVMTRWEWYRVEEYCRALTFLFLFLGNPGLNLLRFQECSPQRNRTGSENRN